MDNSQNPLGPEPMNQRAVGPTETVQEVNQRAFKNMNPDEKRDFVLTYQAPRPDQIPKFVAVREGIEAAYKAVQENCPPCADTSHTLRVLRDARMWANAAIALDGVV